MKTKKIYQTKARKQKKSIFKFQMAILFVASIVGVSAILGQGIMPEQAFADVNVKSELQIFPEPETDMKKWVLTEVYKAGLNPKEAEKIIDCESKWNDQATNNNGKYGIDRGLWQISDKYHKEVSNSDAYDYKKSTIEAIKIYKKRGNWGAWACSRLLGIK
jgi:hypothetical protein